MFENCTAAHLPPSHPPVLHIVVDTEEEFDWSAPFSRTATAVTATRAQFRAHDIFSRFQACPTYVVDYPIATTDTAVAVLSELRRAGLCEIGAHLHPWVSPPFREAVNAHNSYPGNLPPELEREKLERLTHAIEDAFGERPRIYKAGRYGFGPHTGDILEALGYGIDSSAVPHTAFTQDGGPDFLATSWRPFWFGRERRLLELPTTCGFAGRLAAWGPHLFPRVTAGTSARIRLPGVLARTRLLERMRLTPEGMDLAAMCRLTQALLRQGCQVFTMAYHSPSLEPGHTPYVRDGADLAAFLARLEGYLRYFTDRLGGVVLSSPALAQALSGASNFPAQQRAGAAASRRNRVPH